MDYYINLRGTENKTSQTTQAPEHPELQEIELEQRVSTSDIVLEVTSLSKRFWTRHLIFRSDVPFASRLNYEGEVMPTSSKRPIYSLNSL